MRNEIQDGKNWIEATIKQCSSVDVEIEWIDDFGPPGPVGIRNIPPFCRVAVTTPDGQRDIERIPREDIRDCAHDQNAEVRQRVEQQILKLLSCLGIAK